MYHALATFLILLAAVPVAGMQSAMPSSQYVPLIQAAREALKQNNAAEAIRLADSAISVDGSRWEGFAVKGAALLTLGRADDAVAAISRALELAPTASKAPLSEMLVAA